MSTLTSTFCINEYLQGGVYMLLLMDTYSATYALVVLALSECIALGWVYGTCFRV